MLLSFVITDVMFPVRPLPMYQAYRKFDILTSKHIESLRKFTKQIQDARLASNNDAIKTSLKFYDAALERCVVGCLF